MATMTGPFFAPNVDEVVDSEIEKGRHQITEAAHSRVQALLQDFLQNPTGYYQSRVVTDMSVGDTDLIHDSNVVYGPWLEGTGSRNRTTRFKGYHVFRIVTRGMQQRAVDLADIDAGRIARLLS
jgi:hypothetical protein